jgi:arsenite/tail-anchored protein-transporting ATPase
MALSAAARGTRTLIVSTDPASSLGDALGARNTRRRIGATPQPLRWRRATLHAAHVDAGAFIRRWIRQNGGMLEQIALRGTWLDRDDVVQLLRLSLPGIDEIAALLELARLGRSGRYDLIVVDTAPTGHTLRMLQTPQALAGLARVFDAMQAKHRVMVEALRGSWTADAADEFIEELDRDARALAALAGDRDRTEFVWVTLPEPMAVEETIDALDALATEQIPVASVVVNRVTPAPPRKCAWCDSRRAFERQSIATLHARLSGAGRPLPKLVAIDAREREPVGLRALGGIGEALDAAGETVVRPARARRTVARRVFRPGRARDVLETDRVRLLMFGGKGGVGKTTCAAAAALAAARRSPHRRVLLISTDPAHSLADVLGAVCTDDATPLSDGPPNLSVRELDASRAYDELRERYATAVDALFDGLGRGSAFDAAHDRRVMHGLLDLAPPGIDELVAVVEMTEALAPAKTGGSFDLIVMDTAPTGHALRLLEMPGLVHAWVKALMRILLKYQPIVGVGDLGALLLQVSRELGRLRTVLSDAASTTFVVVSRGARLPREESERLILRLRRMKIPVSTVIVNGVGRGSCSRCRRMVAQEQREIRRLSRAARAVTEDLRTVLTPNHVPPPHGVDRLLNWHGRWTGLPR